MAHRSRLQSVECRDVGPSPHDPAALARTTPRPVVYADVPTEGRGDGDTSESPGSRASLSGSTLKAAPKGKNVKQERHRRLGIYTGVE